MTEVYKYKLGRNIYRKALSHKSFLSYFYSSKIISTQNSEHINYNTISYKNYESGVMIMFV